MTSVVVLGVLLALSAVTAAAVAGWIIAALLSPMIGRLAASSSSRAAWLAQARLLPLALAMLLVPAQVVAFMRFEAGVAESAGPLLIVTALTGLALVIDAAAAGWRSWRQTYAIVTVWRRSAQPLEVPRWSRRAWSIRRRFPIVAVVGIVRPQLYVARKVTCACSGDELAAIAAHEAAHVRACDNLLRFCCRITPGAWVARSLADRLERQWMAAAEEAADAAARQDTSALDLASALTKVARMAAGRSGEAVTASALIGGSDLDARVRRLLDPPTETVPVWRAWLPALLLVGSLVALTATPTLAVLHELFELLVRR